MYPSLHNEPSDVKPTDPKMKLDDLHLDHECLQYLTEKNDHVIDLTTEKYSNSIIKNGSSINFTKDKIIIPPGIYRIMYKLYIDYIDPNIMIYVGVIELLYNRIASMISQSRAMSMITSGKMNE